MDSLILFFLIFAVVILIFIRWRKKRNSKRHTDYSEDKIFLSDAQLRRLKSRRDYYNDVYLKSDEWKRKRYVVFKRDNWRCVYCGAPATQVHHKKYAKKNIGKEPIDWLVSVCKTCHDNLHH